MDTMMAARDNCTYIHWIIQSNVVTTHPVRLGLLRTDGGIMLLDLRTAQATRLAEFIGGGGGVDRAGETLGVLARQGTHAATVVPTATCHPAANALDALRGVSFCDPVSGLSALVPEDCAARLAAGMTEIVLGLTGHVVGGAGSADGVRRRTDDNLRGVFG